MPTDPWYLILWRQTLVQTQEGMCEAGSLRVGAKLISADGTLVPVASARSMVKSGQAIARRSVIEIERGALDDNLPNRTITLPKESILRVGDARIGASSLVNDMTILSRDTDLSQLFYIGLKMPGVFDVEGLGIVALSAEDSKASVALADPNELAEIRSGVLSRALDNGWCRVEDRRIQVVVDGAILTPAAATASHSWFILKKPAQVFQLYSAAAAVTDWAPASSDDRTLGVQVMGLRADGADVPLDGACFGKGFHHLELDGSKRLFRWLDGSATLNLSAPTTVLEVTIGVGAVVMKRSSLDHGEQECI